MPHRDIKRQIEALKAELEQTPNQTGSLEEVLEQARNGIFPDTTMLWYKWLHDATA